MKYSGSYINCYRHQIHYRVIYNAGSIVIVWETAIGGKCEMSLLELGRMLFSPVEDQICFLHGKCLLASNKSCHRCGAAMQEGRRSGITDKFVWRCRNCKTTKTNLFFFENNSAEVVHSDVLVGTSVFSEGIYLAQ